MILDAHITELRLKAIRELPWPIPATVLLEMTDEDFDLLAVAADNSDQYWRVLNAVVRCIESRSAAGRSHEEAA